MYRNFIKLDRIRRLDLLGLMISLKISKFAEFFCFLESSSLLLLWKLSFKWLLPTGRLAFLLTRTLTKCPCILTWDTWLVCSMEKHLFRTMVYELLLEVATPFDSIEGTKMIVRVKAYNPRSIMRMHVEMAEVAWTEICFE